MAFWNLPPTLQPKQQHRWVISFVNKTNDPANQSAVDDMLFLAKSIDLPSFEIGVQQAKYLYSHNFNFPKKLVWKPITITFYDALMTDIPVAPYKLDSIFHQPVINEDATKILESYDQKVFDIDGNEKNIVDEENGFFFRQSTQSFFYSLIQKAGYYNPEEHSDDQKLVTFKNTIFKKDLIENFIGENTTLNITQLINRERNDARDTKAFLRETWRLHNPIITDLKFDKLDYSQENILLITITVHYDWADFIPSTPDQYLMSKEEVELLSQPDFESPKEQQETWVERNITTIEERQRAEKELKSRIDKNISDLAQRFRAEPTKSTAIPAVSNPADSATTENITRNLQNAGVTGPITFTQGGIVPSSAPAKPKYPFKKIQLFPPFDKE